MKFSGLFKKQANLGTTALIIIGILIVLNFLSYQIFFTLDLTQNKDYSISRVTKDSISRLDDIVNIKAYFSKELPSQYINLPQEVGDILASYSTYSGGKVRFEFIDPKDDQDLARELSIKGVPQLQFNVMSKDKFQVVNGYLGLTISYGDKTEVIPVIQDTSNLEYEITSKVRKVTMAEAPVIGFLSSHGALSVENDIKEAYRNLSSLYEVELVDLTTEKEIRPEIQTLVVAGPKSQFSKEQVGAIDKFVMRGGSLLLLLDAVRVGNNLSTETADLGLDRLLETYGLKLDKNLVLDTSSGMASFNQGFITFNINYPFWPKIIKSGFDQDYAAVAKLESLVLPWASSIEIQKDKLDPSVKISTLAKTTDQAWVQTAPFNLNPQQGSPTGKAGVYNLAAAISGKLASGFGNGSTDNGRVILVGDSDFLRDNLLATGDNLIFFQNLVDGLTLDEGLISIRSKGILSRPVKELSDGAKATARYLNVFGLTVLVIAFGLFRYYSRRKSRLVDEI